MSTKIYNGYKVPLMSKGQLTEWCCLLKPLVEYEKNRQLANFFVNRRLASLDMNQFLGTDLESWDDLQKDLQKKLESAKKGYREPLVDLSMNVLFIPIEGQMLALLYTENGSLRELWDKYPGVEEYHYQNQTDKPSCVTKKSWDERRLAWDIAIPTGVPSQSKNAVNYDFTTIDCENVTPKFIETHFVKSNQNLENRINNVLINLVFEYWHNNVNPNKEIFEFSAASEWEKSDAGKRIKTEKKEEVQNKIKKYQTFEELFKQ